MMATSDQRVNTALDVIEEFCGSDERGSVETKLTLQTQKQYGDALEIGGFRGGVGFLKSDKETVRRSLVRAILLTQLVQGKLQTAHVDPRRTVLMSQDTARLEKELVSLFPYKAFRGQFANRTHWEPINFTNPWKHTNNNYMYMVHGIMGEPSRITEVVGVQQSSKETLGALYEKHKSYAKMDKSNPIQPKLMVRFFEQYLKHPNIIQQNIISSTVISHQKHATYYPFGFIMRVPPECIYITSPSDVGVANRTSNIVNELRSKHGGGILPPQQILAQTTGTENDNNYNEVVVVGTSPEGRQVEVIGLYVKSDGKGNIYMRNGLVSKDLNEPYVNKEIQKLIQDCATDRNLPIVSIVDTSSRPSTTKWPFD
jgi:hypothetical protein